MKTNHIQLTIVKKTTKNVTFKVSNKDRELKPFTASNGILIKIMAYPHYNTDSKTLYLQGSAPSLDGMTISVSTAEYKKITAAVEEFNNSMNKLMLKIEKLPTNSNSDVVAFKIVEQKGFNYCLRHAFGGINFLSINFPYFYADTNEFCVRGEEKDKDNDIICVTAAEFKKLEAAINLLNNPPPKFIEKITFLYTKDGTKTRRCLNVIEKNKNYYYGVDEDKSEPRKFLVKNMSKIEVIK